MIECNSIYFECYYEDNKKKVLKLYKKLKIPNSDFLYTIIDDRLLFFGKLDSLNKKEKYIKYLRKVCGIYSIISDDLNKLSGIEQIMKRYGEEIIF